MWCSVFPLSCEKVVDNFFFVGAALFARFFFIRFAGNPCYNDTIENCTHEGGALASSFLYGRKGGASC